MKAIIFGANGQDAFFLNELLEEKGIKVIKISRNNAQIIGDVSDYKFVYSLIEEYLPDYIFHLAATSSTNHSFLFENNQSISNGTINILESVRLVIPTTKVFLSGSAMQFKNNGLPIDEETEFDASSPYSVARIHAAYLGRYYREYFNLKVYIGYFFNHDSEFRSAKHINKKIIDELRLIKSGKQSKLVIGNREVKKEFNFAGDVVNAVWVLVNQEQVYEAVIGSGIAYSINDWIKIVCDLLGINYDNLIIETDNKYKSEYKTLVSNPQKIKSIGWECQVDIISLATRMTISKHKLI
jgi:GDPmannose 4,6-dehydratase